MKAKPRIVAVSGGFDPIHIGHVRMFKKAKALGDTLVVIVNNDSPYRRYFETCSETFTSQSGYVQGCVFDSKSIKYESII